MPVRLRWSEMLLAGVAVVALWRVTAERSRAQALTARASTAATAADSSVRGLAAARRQVAGLQRFARFATLDSSVELRGSTFKGAPVELHLARLPRPTVLYAIDPRCPSCLENIPFLNRLAADSSCALDAYGVMLNDAALLPQATLAGMTFDLVRNPVGSAWQALPLAVPGAAVVLGPRGRLEGMWLPLAPGGPQEGMRQRIEQVCRRDVP